jgi:hypothetical protein
MIECVVDVISRDAIDSAGVPVFGFHAAQKLRMSESSRAYLIANSGIHFF